eukprot:Nitzschia sp. Nitz4//scaffold325_size20118//5361//6818//NITZ4_008701-RA/size20118-augustus-gene-0.16-mRNA-1//1//CDS//3329547896//7180//frame0
MMRRSFHKEDALPTHGGLGGVSSPRSSFSLRRTSRGSSGSMFGDDSKYHKHRAPINLSLMTKIAIGIGVFNFLLVILWWNAHRNLGYLAKGMDVRDARRVLQQIQQLERDLADAKGVSQERIRESIQRHESLIKNLQDEKQKYTKERDELKEKYESEARKADLKRLKDREIAFLEQIKHLEAAMRRESHRAVVEKFGPGPHEVQMTFLHDNTDYDLVIELAPVELVPHAVELFLEQVEHGLWSGTQFYLATDHVLQAGPRVDRKEYEDAERQGKEWTRASKKPFIDLQLDTLSFPDYSHMYQHLEWTVGFAGRPGGPDIYVNRFDNSEAHGPGGQTQHALHEQGDSCFGRISKGKEHIENIIDKLPTEPLGTEWEGFFTNPITIVRATVLTPKPNASSTSSVKLPEIPEPDEVQFGQALSDTLTQMEQSQKADPVTSHMAHHPPNDAQNVHVGVTP